jgi:hypothetical protein
MGLRLFVAIVASTHNQPYDWLRPLVTRVSGIGHHTYLNQNNDHYIQASEGEVNNAMCTLRSDPA